MAIWGVHCAICLKSQNQCFWVVSGMEEGRQDSHGIGESNCGQWNEEQTFVGEAAYGDWSFMKNFLEQNLWQGHMIK